LPLREAARLVRSLTSPREREVLQRLCGSVGRNREDQNRRVIRMLEHGRLSVRMLQRRSVAGEAREDELDSDDPPPRQPVDNHTVAIELVDVDGNPVPFEPFRIRLPDGQIQTSALDRYGRARISGIRDPGNCIVCFHERDAACWSPV